MSDTVAYVMIVALVVLPAYGLIRLCMTLLGAMYANQSLILSFPFP